MRPAPWAPFRKPRLDPARPAHGQMNLGPRQFVAVSATARRAGGACQPASRLKELGNDALRMQRVLPTGPSRAGRGVPTAGSRARSARDSHIFGHSAGDNDPPTCPVWIVSRTPIPSPHRSSACWSHPDADGLVGAHVVPLVEGKRRELDRRDVCPGGPTGQGPALRQIVHPSRPRKARLAAVDDPRTAPVDNSCRQRHRLPTPTSRPGRR